MLYQVTLTVPATDRASKTVKIHEDCVTKLECVFLPGCMHQVRVALFYGRMRLWPSPEADKATGDNEKLFDEFFYELPEKPCRLRIEAKNDDPNYEHKIVFRIYAENKETALYKQATVKTAEMMTGLTEFFGIW